MYVEQVPPERYKTPSPDDPADAVRGNGFRIQADARIFTLFAYLNSVAGYDDENGAEMTPERVMLRQDMATLLEKADPAKVKKWKDYAGGHRSHSWQHLYYVLARSGPPGFAEDVKPEDLEDKSPSNNLRGLDAILSDMYVTLDLESLYRGKYQSVMMNAVKAYDTTQIEQDVASVYAYTRLAPELAKEIDLIIIPIPFDSHYVAYAAPYNKRLYVLDGPGSNANGLNAHEYLHKLINPLVINAMKGQENKFQALMQQNRDKGYVKGNYEDTNTFVYECMVRAIDHRLALTVQNRGEEKVYRVVTDETNNGLVLVSYFYEKLADYEKNLDLTLQEFIREALVAYQPQ